MAKQHTFYPISKRTVLIGILLIVINTYWLAYAEMLWHTAHLTTVALSVNVLFTLLIITWLNAAVRRVAPSAELSQQEMLVIYSMVAVGSAFTGHDNMPRLMGLMPYAHRFASPENDWRALFFHHLPNWLIISDSNTVQNFYEGNRNFFTDGYLEHWITPILSWSIVIFLLMVIFLCLTTILRKQWVENEKLSYPIIQIPFEITARSSAVYGKRLSVIGFAIPAAIGLINGFHSVLPSLPRIVTDYDLNIYFTQKPWNALGSLPIRFNSLMIGIAFLLPLDLLFSCVFFYFVNKAQLLIGSAAGVQNVPGYPFFGEQGAGALFALLVVACWSGRKHISHVFYQAFRSERMRDTAEPIPYRWSVIILCVCLLLLMGFCVKGGMSVWACAVFVGVYLSIVVGLARMRAELGPPVHGIGYVTPQYLIVSMFGTRRLRAPNLTMLSLLNWLSGASYASFRTHPMPDQLEAFKLANRSGIRNRTMLVVLLIASIVGIESSLLIYPYTIYETGVAANAEQIHSGGLETYTFLSSWLIKPEPTNWLAIAVLVSAFFFNLGVMLIRTRYIWCPLHPAGYVIGLAPNTPEIIWFPLLVAMVARWLILKHSGIKGYRRAIPFFVGLAIGETLMSCFWAIRSVVFHTT